MNALRSESDPRREVSNNEIVRGLLMRSSGTFRRALVIVTLALHVGCGSNQSDAPGSPSNPFDKPVLTITVSPNPVPFSGQPVTFSACVGIPNTWFYNEVFTESGGILVTLNSAIATYANGRTQTITFTAPAGNPYAYTVPANGTLSVSWPSCFPTMSGNTVQHTYSGTDFNNLPVTVTGPIVMFAPK